MILDPLVDSTSAVTVASCMKVYFNCELLLRTVPTLLLLLVLCIGEEDIITCTVVVYVMDM